MEKEIKRIVRIILHSKEIIILDKDIKIDDLISELERRKNDNMMFITIKGSSNQIIAIRINDINSVTAFVDTRHNNTQG